MFLSGFLSVQNPGVGAFQILHATPFSLQPTERTCYKAAFADASRLKPFAKFAKMVRYGESHNVNRLNKRQCHVFPLLFQLLPVPNFALRAQVAMSAILAVLAAALLPKPQLLMWSWRWKTKKLYNNNHPIHTRMWQFQKQRAPVKWWNLKNGTMYIQRTCNDVHSLSFIISIMIINTTN